MIIDCFTFFNEIDLLKIRLAELYPFVDKFVLVEAELTQSLLPKPYYFEDNKSQFSDYLDKIIHIKIPKEKCVDNSSNLWKMENFQRNYIRNALDDINTHDEDIIFISDLDEIPSNECIKPVNQIFSIPENKDVIFSLNMDFFAYFLNLKASSRSWVGTTVCKFQKLKQLSPQILRNNKDYYPLMDNAGWHFSWLGGYEKVYQKSLSCIEPFDKTKLPTKEQFKTFFENFKNSTDKFFIHLEDLNKKETPFSICEIDQFYPMEIFDNREKYKQYIL